MSGGDGTDGDGLMGEEERHSSRSWDRKKGKKERRQLGEEVEEEKIKKYKTKMSRRTKVCCR